MDGVLDFEDVISSLYTHLLPHINFSNSDHFHLHRPISDFQEGDECSPQGLEKAHCHLFVYLCCCLRTQHSCNTNSNCMVVYIRPVKIGILMKFAMGYANLILQLGSRI